mmetsp:Transcript_50799/g.146586  ORF Transcript_50799/g.146586 Transcript_50799/m.146586 type:complete len:209 (-) Transcript_50799:431-1057(-)
MPPKTKPIVGNSLRFEQSSATPSLATRVLTISLGPPMTLVPVSKAATQPRSWQRPVREPSMTTSAMWRSHMPISGRASRCHITSGLPTRALSSEPNVISESSPSPSIANQTAKRSVSKTPAPARLPMKLKCLRKEMPGMPKPKMPSYGRRPNGSSDICKASTMPVWAHKFSSGPKQTLSLVKRPVTFPAPIAKRTVSLVFSSPRPAVK